MRRNTKLYAGFLFLAALAAGGTAGLPAPAAATTWYVDGVNGKQSNPGTATAPFLNFYQSMLMVQPGDTVYVLPTRVYPQLNINVSGTPGQPISVIGAGSGRARTRASGDNVSPAIWVNASYINVMNFDATTSGAQSAILVSENHHHNLIANNVAHNAGGNGISTFTDDYITISHNIVYGNAWNTSGGVFASGISTLGSFDIDSNTGVKMIIDGNVVYANTNTPTCSTQQCLDTWSDSDGSGIIVDNNQRTRFDNIPYRGRTQISNNVVFGNGGRGIHMYLSDHITVVDNTVVFNNKDPYEGFFHPGEVSAVASGDVQVYNNVLYSDGLNGPTGGSTPNTHVSVSFESCTDGTGPMIAKYNLTFNPQNAPTLQSFVDSTTTNPVTIAQNIWNGAKLENPMIQYPSSADFRPKPISPLLFHGDAATSMAVDMLGAPRVLPPTIGAYQNPGP